MRRTGGIVGFRRNSYHKHHNQPKETRNNNDKLLFILQFNFLVIHLDSSWALSICHVLETWRCIHSVSRSCLNASDFSAAHFHVPSGCACWLQSELLPPPEKLAFRTPSSFRHLLHSEQEPRLEIFIIRIWRVLHFIIAVNPSHNEAS